jgi:mRNA-degrading endonuclease toxin of MazEF toxin-antitoxin module
MPEEGTITGVVLSDHVKSADWEERNAVYAGAAPVDVLAEVRARLKPLLGT